MLVLVVGSDHHTSHARRRLALGEATSTTSPNDESRAQSPHAGGGGRRTLVADRPDEDGSDDQLDQDAFLNTLAVSGQPMLKQFGVFLKAKDETISVLQHASAQPEDLPRAITMVTELSKSVRNKIFARNLRDNYVSTLPRELSSRDSMHYSKEQKEKDDTLAKLHKDFAPVL